VTRATSLFLFMAVLATSSQAAPDEERLGKANGYPVGTRQSWFYDEAVRVGSFTHQAEIDGIIGGRVNTLMPSTQPMPLPKSASPPDYRWSSRHERSLTTDDYLGRQRIMGLMIIKDGVVQLERYQYGRTKDDRFLSNSMAKSIVSLAIGIALQEGQIKSLDDRADAYAPALNGTLYGETSIRNLLRMASGARFTERYDNADDLARYGNAVARSGIEAAARTITARAAPAGTVFNYASAETDMLGAVLRGATGMTLSEYLTPRLWQPIGAASSALWRTDRTGLERASGNFNATLEDYGRLAIVLANNGVRPDDPERKQIIPSAYLIEATNAQMVPNAFRPKQATPYYGYGYLFWLFPGEKRRFALLGVYGQMIFVDPELKLIMVQTAANATPRSGDTTLAADADRFWRGVVSHYGNW
jgi:CubicO group peptidase (beta-lactamase class C family)